MAADILTDHGDEAAFGILAELIVVGGFLADDESSAVIAGVKPYRRGGGGASDAVKSYARAHFDEGSALRQFCRFLVLDPDQGDPLIVLEDTDGTDRDFIASFGLADEPPVSGSEHHQADHEHRCQHDGSKNDEGFFQRCFRKGELQRDTLVEKGASVNRLGNSQSRGLAPVLWL